MSLLPAVTVITRPSKSCDLSCKTLCQTVFFVVISLVFIIDLSCRCFKDIPSILNIRKPLNSYEFPNKFKHGHIDVFIPNRLKNEINILLVLFYAKYRRNASANAANRSAFMHFPFPWLHRAKPTLWINNFSLVF